jgi:hypothetical protein
MGLYGVEVVRCVDEAWHDNDLAALDGLVAEDFSAHPRARRMSSSWGRRRPTRSPFRRSRIARTTSRTSSAGATRWWRGTDDGDEYWGPPWFGIPAEGSRMSPIGIEKEATCSQH